jgi:hypothetical protein
VSRVDHGPAAPVAQWAASGAMALTGWAGQPPTAPPGPVGPRLGAITGEIAERTSAAGRPVRLDWGGLLTGRAALLGLQRNGRTSANGSCRLLRAADGWVALNLARPDDLASLDALAGAPVTGDPWVAVEELVAGSAAAAITERGRLLGLPVAVLRRPAPVVEAAPTQPRWTPTAPRPAAGLRVVDLSSMWAGPLAARVLMAAGAAVTKVESRARPDGARRTPALFDWLHPAAQETVTLPFESPAGRSELRQLIEKADVVIEGSRPRALEQLGTGPDDVRDRDGRVWLSITGHGREPPGRDWVGFGDDAAVAGGLVAWDGRGEPVFCADAVADPVTGLIGALAVLRALAAGGGRLIDLALARAAAAVATTPAWGSAPPGPGPRPAVDGGWELDVDGATVAVREPVPPGSSFPDALRS